MVDVHQSGTTPATTVPPARPRSGPEELAATVESLRTALRGTRTQVEAAERVAAALQGSLPSVAILTAEQLAGDPDHYSQHVLHVEPDGAFSVVALVWLPGQVTPVHDHLCWCVVGVVQGTENEMRYEVVTDGPDGAERLRETQAVCNPTGSVCGFAPPGDIHLVRNPGPGTAVSLHVYGADIGSCGSSIRRAYDLPVVPR